MADKLYLSYGAQTQSRLRVEGGKPRPDEWFIVEPRDNDDMLYQIYSLTAVGRTVVAINLDDRSAQEIEPRLAEQRWIEITNRLDGV